MNSLSLSVGELAAQTGLTVRTLHHYEAEGLLSPDRTPAGHRRYGPREVERLQQIASLRAIGVPVAQIPAALDDPAFDPVALAERQRAALADEVARATTLDRQLAGLARHLHLRSESGEPVSPSTFLHLLRTMNDIETHYTPDQLAQLAERRETLGDDAVQSVEAEWPRLFDALSRQLDAGTDAAAPAVQALVDRWDELVALFTGGDAGVASSLGDAVEMDRDGMAGMMGLTPERMRALFAYAQRARDARS